MSERRISEILGVCGLIMLLLSLHLLAMAVLTGHPWLAAFTDLWCFFWWFFVKAAADDAAGEP